MAVSVAASPMGPHPSSLSLYTPPPPRTSAAASFGLFFVRPRKVKSDLPTTIREVSMNGESFAFKGKKWENSGCWGPFYKPSRICNYCYCLLMEIFSLRGAGIVVEWLSPFVVTIFIFRQNLPFCLQCLETLRKKIKRRKYRANVFCQVQPSIVHDVSGGRFKPVQMIFISL